MHTESIVFTIFLIFTGAAALATVTLYLRQAMILAYIVLGGIVGPAGFGLVENTELVSNIAEIGIMFLLYLLGLNLYPQKLLEMLQEALRVTVWSCLAFFALGATFALILGMTPVEILVVGAASMFSSTILGLKLLPTTALHHKHAGEVIISILLLQDLVAILVLLALRSAERGLDPATIGLTVIGLPVVLVVAFGAARYVLPPLLHRFDQIQEYVFLLAIGWCLGLAMLAAELGLTLETGAFIAGVAVATSPIARYIAEALKPLRDFFLVIFFFALGARLELEPLQTALLPAGLFALVILVAKPLIFRWLLVHEQESAKLSGEIGARLGQISEFSLLIALLGASSGVISERASYFIQVATLIGFIGSSYFIVMRYPTPIAVSDKLRRD